MSIIAINPADGRQIKTHPDHSPKEEAVDKIETALAAKFEKKGTSRETQSQLPTNKAKVLRNREWELAELMAEEWANP